MYELLEAMMANILTPERGEEFVGMQGDIWDSQKDMLMATLGAITVMVIVAVVRHRRAAALARATGPRARPRISGTSLNALAPLSPFLMPAIYFLIRSICPRFTHS